MMEILSCSGLGNRYTHSLAEHTDRHIISIRHDIYCELGLQSWLIFWNTSVGDLILVGNCSLHFLGFGLGTGEIGRRSYPHSITCLWILRVYREMADLNTGLAIYPRHPHGWFPLDLCLNVLSQWELPEPSYLESPPPTLALLVPFLPIIFLYDSYQPPTNCIFYSFIISFPQLERKLYEGQDFQVFVPHCMPSN